MKTQIIRIEQYDDAISIKDKMEWYQTSRILIVWPKRIRILNRRLDIIYLKRHAAALGAQLAFVTKDPAVRYHAENLNIPVYHNTRKAEQDHWRPASRRKRQQNKDQTASFLRTRVLPRKLSLVELGNLSHPNAVVWLTHPIPRLSFFTIGVLSVIAIALLFLPSAVVQIWPESQIDTLKLPISASIINETIDITGKIPVQIISVTVEGRGSIPSTGYIEIPDQKAKGKVLFENLTDQNIAIPAGTIISTLDDNPTRFYLSRSAEILPGENSELIPIEATMPGKSGNVPSNKIRAIEGSLGLDLTVTNPIPTTGGSNQISPAPKDKDYQTILEEMIISLQSTAENELQAKLNPQDILLDIDPDNYKILEIQYFPEKSQPSDQLQITLQIAFQAYKISSEDLLHLGEAISDANIPVGYIKRPNSLKIQNLTEPTRDDDGIFRWDIEINWQSEALIDMQEVTSQILWKPPAEAERSLAVNPNINETVQVTINPEWWPRLPILPFRINIINKQSQ